MKQKMILFSVPGDKNLQAALGVLVIRHGHLEYTLRMTIKSLCNLAFTLTGEIVSEFGTTNAKNHTLSATSQNREAVGGHIDGTLSFNEFKFSPYIKGRYSHFPGDDPATNVNEAFDPLFFKNDEFGTWGAGDINSYSLSNTNQSR